VRPARYQDIAILVRTRTNLPAIESALEEMGIPYRVESRSLLFKTQEVRDLISILAAIDDPADQVALAAALRSPAFACGDDDLLAYANAGGRWDYLSPAPPGLPADHPVVSTMASLAGWHRGRWWLSIGEIVDSVIRERRLFELAFAHRRPQERWQRYRFVQGHARAFAGEPGTSLRRFVAWLRRQAEEGAMVAESPVPDPDDDAVRIMTVHAAKGLEFPVVCLAGLGTRPMDRPGKTLWTQDGRPVPRIKDDLESEAFANLAAHHKEMEAYETHRLLYVAATRARDHLIVGLHSPDRSAVTPAQLIHDAAQADPALWNPFAFPDELLPEARTEPEQFSDSPALRAAWLAELGTVRRRAERPASVAATTIARTIADGLAGGGDEKPEPSEDDPSWRRGRAGTSVGRAVHAVLQGIDLATGEGLEQAAIAQASAEGIPGRQAEVARLARAALAAPSVREAVSSGKFWRELFVGVPVGEQLLEGFIDLLYQQPGGGLVVVDYKTDAVRDEADVDEKLARYRLQGAAYALALERSLGRPVTACRFIFLAPSGAIEREAGDLRTAMAEVEAFLSSTAS
jgi:ATP-dependent exoDNAse (exonuclease V) beta subunit